MTKNFLQLKEYLAEVSDLNYAKALLDWDQQTNMPVGAAPERACQSAALAKIIHQKSTSKELGSLLDQLASEVDQYDADSDDACLIRLSCHHFEKQKRIPSQWVESYTRAASEGQSVWQAARKQSNFSLFQPCLQRLVDLACEYAGFFTPYEHIYDPLLDDYERGLKTADVKKIFESLRSHQVSILKTISQHEQIDTTSLAQSFDKKAQWDFGIDVITRFGFDWNSGRQDISAHPFTNSLGMNDVRITTRLYEDNLCSGLFSSMHECGHALYEQGLNPCLRRTPLATGASMAVHESQSRLWENLVGRSRPFWCFFFPRLQQVFSKQLENIDLETFYRAINRVEPSLIRVESDEATYNLHIMLRLELEIELLEGKLAVKDLPDAWNSRMQEYLGIIPDNDTRGVLQDVHWSAGLIGYFPTYALGNLISAQIWECIQIDIPDLDEQISTGEFSNLLEWLRKKIHSHGAKFEPQELVKHVTGSPIDAQPYLRYLKKKYSEIYGFSA